MDIKGWVQLRDGLNEVPQGLRAMDTQLVTTAPNPEDRAS